MADTSVQEALTRVGQKVETRTGTEKEMTAYWSSTKAALAALLRRDPDVVYYVAYLASKRLRALATRSTGIIEDIEDALDSFPVEGTVYTAAEIRSVREQVEEVALVMRSDLALERGLGRLRKKARAVLETKKGTAHTGGTVHQNGDEALASALASTTDLVSAMEQLAAVPDPLIALLEQHAVGEIYEDMLLARADQASGRLRQLELDAAVPDTRTARDTTQDIIASVASMRGHAVYVDPTAAKISGALVPVAPSLPASLVAARRPPYVFDSDTLSIDVDGTTQAWALPDAEYAKLAMRVAYPLTLTEETGASLLSGAFFLNMVVNAAVSNVTLTALSVAVAGESALCVDTGGLGVFALAAVGDFAIVRTGAGPYPNGDEPCRILSILSTTRAVVEIPASGFVGGPVTQRAIVCDNRLPVSIDSVPYEPYIQEATYMAGYLAGFVPLASVIVDLNATLPHPTARFLVEGVAIRFSSPTTGTDSRISVGDTMDATRAERFRIQSRLGFLNRENGAPLQVLLTGETGVFLPGEVVTYLSGGVPETAVVLSHDVVAHVLYLEPDVGDVNVPVPTGGAAITQAVPAVTATEANSSRLWDYSGTDDTRALAVDVSTGGLPTSVAVNVAAGTYDNAAALKVAVDAVIPATLMTEIIGSALYLEPASGAAQVRGTRGWLIVRAGTANPLLGLAEGMEAHGVDVRADQLVAPGAALGIAVRIVPSIIATSVAMNVTATTPPTADLIANVQAGDRISIQSEGTGDAAALRWLRVVSVGTDIEFDEAIPLGTYTVSVRRDTVTFYSQSAALDSALQATAGTAQAELGLPTAEARGQISSVQVGTAGLAAAVASPVRVGDLVSWSAGSGTVERILSTLDTLVLEDGIDNDETSAASVYAMGVASYAAYRQALYAWWRGFSSDAAIEEAAFQKDLNAARRSHKQRVALRATLTELKASLATLVALGVVSANRIQTFDDVLEGLQSRRMDRARDLLMSARVQDFFSTSAQETSYWASALVAAAGVVSELPPELDGDVREDAVAVDERDGFFADYEESVLDARDRSYDSNETDDDEYTYG